MREIRFAVPGRVAGVLVGAAVFLLSAQTGVAGPSDEDAGRLGRLVAQTVAAGDVTTLTKLIDAGEVEIDGRYRWQGCSATMLAMAVGSGKLDAAVFLLEQGADADLPAICVQGSGKDAEGVEAYTPLMVAARAGFPAGAEILIAKGADVDAQGLGGLTALIVAAAFDSPDVGRVLLHAKADPEAQADDLRGLREIPDLHKVSSGPAPAFVTRTAPGVRVVQSNVPSTPSQVMQLPPGKGATALWVAAAVGSEAMVKLLLEAGADREAEASCMELRQAPAGEKECSPARIAELLDHQPVARLLGGGTGGATTRVSRSDVARMAPKDLRLKLWQIMDDKDIGALEAYLDAGLDVNGALGEKLNETLLTLACSASAVPAVKLLLERGARPGEMIVEAVEIPTRDPNGRIRTGKEQLATRNPLIAAVSAGCEECVALLIDAGADVKAAIWSGATPLAMAADGPKPEILARLIAAGAPLEEPISRVSSSQQAVATCRTAGATPLWIAACSGREEMVRRLLEAGADPEAEAACEQESRAEKGEATCTARRIAEIRGRTKVLALFDGKEPAAPDAAGGGLSPEQILDPRTKAAARHGAILSLLRRGDLAALQALLAGGLDPDELVFNNGFVPLLSLAIIAKRPELVALLMERGASVDAMSMNRTGPRAANTGFVADLLQTLPEGGVPSDYTPMFSPLMYAAFTGNEQAFEQLLKSKADVNARGLAGITALMAAAGRDRPEMAKRLIDAGARIDERIDNRDRRDYLEADAATALWFAAYAGSAGVVRVLLAAGANPGVEAECRSRAAVPEEKECSPRRIAELREHAAVLRVFDEVKAAHGSP